MSKTFLFRLIPFAFLAVAGFCLADETQWPQFRGPDGSGNADRFHPPERWSATENVAWKTEILGRGWSSPITVGNRVFLTSVVSDVPARVPPKGLVLQGSRGVVPEGTHHWLVLCLDLASGEIEWQREVHQGIPPESTHFKNTYASETPVTDGERVYALFGNVGLYCLSLDGDLIWSRRFDAQPTRSGMGTAASPAVHEGRVFVVCDNERQSHLTAFDAATGVELWRIEREERTNWSSPLVWKNDVRTEVVTAGTDRVRSYDLQGNLLWELEGMSESTIPTPVAGKNLLYVSSGHIGNTYRPLYAIKAGASGDISLADDATSNEFIAWSQPLGAPYQPTPLLIDDKLYVLHDRGTLACFEAASGREVYPRRRLGATAFTASPWYANGKIFCLNEEGDTVVVKAGEEFELLGKNSLGEMCLATPAAGRNRLLIRGLTHLYCLERPTAQRNDVAASRRLEP